MPLTHSRLERAERLGVAVAARAGGAAARPAGTTAGRRRGCGGRSTPAAPARGRAGARSSPTSSSSAHVRSNSLAQRAPDALARLGVVPQRHVALRDRAGRPWRTPSRRWPAAPRRTATSAAISRSSVERRAPRAPRPARVPSPNQAGSTIRACVHENTHGIARSDSMPPSVRRLRRARAEPQARDLVQRRGGGEEAREVRVAVDELAVDLLRARAPSRCTTRSCALASRSAVRVGGGGRQRRRRARRWRSARARGGRSRRPSTWRPAPRPARSSSAAPPTVPGGSARIAVFVGPPPRPSAPPRPWKKHPRRAVLAQHLGHARPARGRSPSPRRRSRRPCWSPSSRPSPPARRRRRAAPRGRRAREQRASIVAGGRLERLAGLEQRHDPQHARPRRRRARGPPPSSAAAPRAGRPGPRCREIDVGLQRARVALAAQRARACGTCATTSRVASLKPARSPGISGRRSAISRASSASSRASVPSRA